MKHYIASVRDKETKKLMLIERDYERKSDFYSDLRNNGYSVRFITTEEKFDEDCEKWHAKNELCKTIHKLIYADHKKQAEKMNMTVREYEDWLKRY